MSSASAADSERLRPRSYQIEMLEESMKQNIIVAMDTGTGKTHIAVMRIHEELKRCGPEQLVWFLAPKRALCEQQYQVIKRNVPGVEARYLSGDDDVDKWTDQNLWDAVLKDMRIIVSTPQVLLDALSHGFVRLSRLALLVIDEAHRAVKGDATAQIMATYVRTAAASEQPHPHILALTASPIMSADPSKLEDVEKNLCATTRTPKIHREELERLINRPAARPIFYHRAELFSSTLADLKFRVDNYDIAEDPYVKELLILKNPLALQNVLRKRKTYCLQQLKLLTTRTAHIGSELGPEAAKWYLQSCTEKLAIMCDRFQEDFGFDGTMKEKKYLLKILQAEAESPVHAESPPASDKLTKLVQLLQDAQCADVTCLIFVQQRATAAALTYCLTKESLLSGKLRVGFFVGSSMAASRHANISDLAEPKSQQRTLEDFRLGDKNVIVCTDVLEEGIDVPSCNLVIAFEPPKNLISFIQRRGRARHENSQFCIFYDQESGQRDWMILEKRMIDVYMDEERLARLEDDRESQYETDGRQLRVHATGATLTLDNSIAHLHHFCRGVNRQHVDSQPQYTIHCDGNTGLFSSSITLPPSVDPILRHARGLGAWRTKKVAKRDAAFVAYSRLYEAKLVNDNLLPQSHDDFDEEGQASEVSRGSLQTCRSLIDPWKSLNPYWMSCQELIPLQIKLTGFSDAESDLLLWIPRDASVPQPFTLFWDPFTEIRVELIQTGRRYAAADCIHHLRHSTQLLLSSTFAHQVVGTDAGFMALVSPLGQPADLPEWLHQHSAPASVSEWIGSLQDPGDATGRVIRDTKNWFGTCLTRKIVQSSELVLKSDKRSLVEEGSEMYIMASKLPKRRDFLHRAQQSQNQTAATAQSARAIPIKDCILQSLPASFSISMRLMPSILHVLETTLIAEELRSTVMRSVGITDLALVTTAISASSAQEITNYQSLEFLGDCVLKLCVSLHLMATNKWDPEAFLSKKKDRMVSNRRLSKIALNVGIDQFIITKPFTGAKWRPRRINDSFPDAETPRELSTKVLADVVEALIGAAHANGATPDQGLAKALACVSLFFPDVQWTSIDCMRDEIFRGTVRDHTWERDASHLAEPEALLGHHFRAKQLLETALTHASYGASAQGMTYERLEFLGDAILDFIVTTRLAAHRGADGAALPHWRMHTLRECVVNGDFLAFLCMEHGLSVSRVDVERVAGRTPRGPDDFQIVQKEDRRHHLYQFMSRDVMSVDLTRSIEDARRLHEVHRRAILQGLEAGRYPWAELLSIGAPKCISDIIESSVAAIWLDSSGSFEAVEGFLGKLGLLAVLRRLLNEQVECVHPKERLGVLAAGETVDYAVARDEGDGHAKERAVRCTVTIGGVEIAHLTAHGEYERVLRTTLEARVADKAVMEWQQQGKGQDVVQLLRRQREASAAQEAQADVDMAQEEEEEEEKKDEGMESSSEGSGASDLSGNAVAPTRRGE